MIEWKISDRPVPYEEAVAFMDARVAGIHEGREAECIWLLEHPPLYTGGTSAKAGDLLDSRFPVFKTGRGGEYTYHGPGQRVVYVMLNLKKRQKVPDIKQYVCDLESWIIRALAELGVTGERRKGRVGIWVKVPHPSSPLARTPSPSREREDQYSEAKIAALGVRVRHWVTLHGISINVNPDLSHFGGIVPCGIKEYGVTSLADLGVSAGMEALDAALFSCHKEFFDVKIQNSDKCVGFK